MGLPYAPLQKDPQSTTPGLIGIYDIHGVSGISSQKLLDNMASTAGIAQRDFIALC